MEREAFRLAAIERCREAIAKTEALLVEAHRIEDDKGIWMANALIAQAKRNIETYQTAPSPEGRKS